MNLLSTLILSPPLAYFIYRIIKEEIARWDMKKKAPSQPLDESRPNGIIKVVPTIKTFSLEISKGDAN